MNVTLNGKIIELQDGDVRTSMLELMCVCGHTLFHHAYTHAWGDINTWYTSQCIQCDIDDGEFGCSQFRMADESKKL